MINVAPVPPVGFRPPFKPAESSDNLPEEVPDATLHVKAVHEENKPCPYPWGMYDRTLASVSVKKHLSSGAQSTKVPSNNNCLFAKLPRQRKCLCMYYNYQRS